MTGLADEVTITVPRDVADTIDALQDNTVGATNGYFLHVDLLVPKRNEEKFETAVKTFLRAATEPFQPFLRLNPLCNLKMVLALKSPTAFAFHDRGANLSGYKKRSSGDLANSVEMLRYVHLWLVPTLIAANLVKTMQLSADDARYIEIDENVARETQNFVYQVQWPATGMGQALPLAKRRRPRTFVRSTRQYPSKEIGIFLFKLGSHFPTMTAEHCPPVATFQNVTGTLDTVVQFWETTKGSAKNAVKVFDRAQDVIRDKSIISFSNTITGKVEALSETSEAFMLAPYSP
jgi:hypothetical protein